MERNRSAALGNFIRFLGGNPDGDAAARAMVMGGLSPFGYVAGQIYAMSTPQYVELVGNYGYPAADAAAFRRIATTVPLPICDAFTSASIITVDSERIHERYPIVAENARTEDTALTRVVSVPTMWSETPIGVLSLLQERGEAESSEEEWAYLNSVASAVALWLNNQRPALVEHWKRAAPLPHRELTLSDRQTKILLMIGENFTNKEIAAKLGYSIPTVKKDLQEIMKMLGTQDRRVTAGRARELGILPDRRAQRENVS